MQKTIIIYFIALLMVSCGEDKKNIVKIDATAFDISTQKWKKKTAVTAATSTVLNEWPEYKALDASFDAIYSSENTEDLTLVLEDLITKQKLLAKSKYPPLLNKPQIKSRQKVFQTFMLKTKGDLEYRMDTEKSAFQMIDAYNALRKEFDIITSDTLDLKSLLYE